MRRAPGVAVLALVVVSSPACGQKGDPLPPLVRVPSAPAGFTAERRAGMVDIVFTVPAANSDGTRPANIDRIEIYAMTGAATIPDADVINLGTRIASLPVKAPLRPNDVVDADDRDADVGPLVGTGLDQGVLAHVREDLSALSPSPASGGVGAAVRHYVGVSVSTRGRRGLTTKRVSVPLGTAPAAPAKPDVRYGEQAIAVTWVPASDPTVSYYVYSPARPADGLSAETRLTATPLVRPEFSDPRIEWGAERCYAVSSIEIRDGLAVESDASVPACVTLADIFAPRAPAGLTAVGADGATNLTWDSNTEIDLSGYLVFRGPAPDALVPITPLPVSETTFRDLVPGAARYVYAVRAVDKSGNAGPLSDTVEATTR